MTWSTFSTASLEREYQAELGSEKVRLTRILAGLGIVLNLAFIPLDLYAIPDALPAIWTIRAVIVAGLVVTLLWTRLPVFERTYQSMIVLVGVLLGGGVNAMIFVATRADVAIDTYYGGLLLIIVAIYTLTHISLYVSTALALSLTAAYAAIAVFHHGFDEGSELITLIARLFVFLSMTIVGIAAQALRDRYSRENYLLRHSLQHDVEIKEAEKRHASYLAEHDPLTGLGNRLRFDRDAGALIEQARGTGTAVHVLFLDLDEFKPINDEHGHAVGDRVLKLVAERLRDNVRAGDIIARVGGDEFVVAMSVPANGTMAGQVAAQKVLTALRTGMHLRGSHLDLSVSIGVAAYPMDGDSLHAVLHAADAQMYVVKKRGKSGIAVSPGCGPGRLAG